MLDGDLFDKLSRIGSMLRKSIQPFGGIQVCPFLSAASCMLNSVAHRDRGFFQLPPVTKAARVSSLRLKPTCGSRPSLGLLT
ncbi:hypothetical protein B0H13DRAFT_283930 [Mycena leptocephala]|nr:hypothetical protein B0H13DRAFT_283930 [Mycena leptocephala]